MDPRFDLPLYTRAEVALHLGLPATTLGDWLRSGALEARSGSRGEPTITFAGLVETHMLRHLRQAGLSLQAIGEAALALRYPSPKSSCSTPGLDVAVVADSFGFAQGAFQGVGGEDLDGGRDAYSVLDAAGEVGGCGGAVGQVGGGFYLDG